MYFIIKTVTAHCKKCGRHRLITLNTQITLYKLPKTIQGHKKTIYKGGNANG